MLFIFSILALAALVGAEGKSEREDRVALEKGFYETTTKSKCFSQFALEVSTSGFPVTSEVLWPDFYTLRDAQHRSSTVAKFLLAEDGEETGSLLMKTTDEATTHVKFVGYRVGDMLLHVVVATEKADEWECDKCGDGGAQLNAHNWWRLEHDLVGGEHPKWHLRNSGKPGNWALCDFGDASFARKVAHKVACDPLLQGTVLAYVEGEEPGRRYCRSTNLTAIPASPRS